MAYLLQLSLSEIEYKALRALAIKTQLTGDDQAVMVAARVALADQLDLLQLLDRDLLITTITASCKPKPDRPGATPPVQGNPGKEEGPPKPTSNARRATPALPMRERDGRTTATWLALRWLLGRMFTADKLGKIQGWSSFTVGDLAMGIERRSEVASSAINSLITTGWLYANGTTAPGANGHKRAALYEFTSSARAWALANQPFLVDHGSIPPAEGLEVG